MWRKATVVVIVRKDMSISMEDQNQDVRVLKEAGYNSCTGCKNPIESTKANLDKCVVWLTRVDFIIQPPLKIWLHAKTWERFKQSGKSCNCGILQLRYKRQFCISLYRNCGINKKKRIQNSTENGLVFVENQTYLFNAQINNFFLRSDFCYEDKLSPDAVFDMRFLFVFSDQHLMYSLQAFSG